MAVVWNALSLTLFLAVLRGETADQPLFIRAVTAGFAAIGVLLLATTLVQTARVGRFRGLRLELDPFPGSLGGQAGGTVDLPIRAGTRLDARATLHCIHSYMRGSGENSRREDVIWSSTVVPEVERSGTGVRLRFAFDVPGEGLPESEPTDTYDPEDHHYWSVHVAAELPGADLDQSFRVPVYRLGSPLRARTPFRPRDRDPRAVGGHGVTVTPTATGVRITYGRSRYGLAGLAFLAFGAVTISSGVFVFSQTSGWGSGVAVLALTVGSLFLVVFGLVGLLLVGFGLYMLLSHITVEVAHGAVRSTRSLLVHRSVREARIDDIAGIEAKITAQSGHGSGARTSYTIYGRLDSGGRITLGDGIRGAYLLDQIRGVLEEATGIGVEVALRKRTGAR